jgi:hypothetical protein
MARRVRFARDFDYRVKQNVIVAYKRGQEIMIPDAHAAAAEAVGAIKGEAPGARGKPKGKGQK